MSKTTKKVWVCDICKNQAMVDEHDKPSGWVSFELENPMVERMWDEKCVCKRCRDEIIREVQK